MSNGMQIDKQRPSSSKSRARWRWLGWLRRQRSGPIYRLRRAYMTARSGPVRPGAVVAAVQELIRNSDVPSTTAVIAGFSLNATAAESRVHSAEAILRTAGALRVAWIGGPTNEALTHANLASATLYPETWAVTLNVFRPNAIVLNATRVSPTGAWAGRLAFSLSPERLAERDLRGLRAEADGRSIPMILILPPHGHTSWSAWQASAAFFDAVIADDAEVAHDRANERPLSSGVLPSEESETGATRVGPLLRAYLKAD